MLQQGDRRGGLVQQRVNEETSISGDIVWPSYLDIRATAEGARRKEHHRRARLQRDPGLSAVYAGAPGGR